MESFDVVVIGAGPGGYPAAIRAAQLGARVALVEQAELGGTCLNRGCIPTKALIAGADLLQHMRAAGELGIRTGAVSADYAAMAQRKEAVVAKLRLGIKNLLQGNKVQVFTGRAAFTSATGIQVAAAGGAPVDIAFSKAIIATGSVPVWPDAMPRSPRVMDSTAFLALTALPPDLIVLGGGYIGCELACLAAALGAKVTVVELLEDVLLLLDPDARREIRRSMEKNLGITVMTGHALENLNATETGVSGQVAGQPIQAHSLLAALGRRPFTAGLDLDQAGLKTDARGFVPVDELNRTAVANVYAVGDCNGGPQLAHAATAQGLVAAEHACGQTPAPNERLVPGVIFTLPEAAVVGLTEQAAARQNQAVATGKFMFGGLGRALAAHATQGFVKWVADAQTRRLLGAAAVGPHATDLIAEATLAIRQGLTAHDLGRVVHAHPTFNEAWMEAAHAVDGACIHAAPRPRRA